MFDKYGRERENRLKVIFMAVTRNPKYIVSQLPVMTRMLTRRLKRLPMFAQCALFVSLVMCVAIYGSALCALNKKDGGIRPIAVGSTLRRLVAKAACKAVTAKMAARFLPVQIGFGIPRATYGEAVLLGAPVGDETSVDTVLSSKLAVFRLLASRLAALNAHDALFLLKNCFSIPKLLYSLRCAACYKSTILPEYDDVIRQTLKVILNVDLSDVIWKQATLPVSSGGLGVRLAVDLALPAFLSSVNGASELTLRLLPSRLHTVSGNRDSVCVAACLEWQTRCDAAVPDPARAGVQKAWDAPVVSRKREELLSAAQNQAGRARLIAAAAPHSGDFLHAVPCSSIGTRLDDTSLRIAVSLRLGATMCAPHSCVCD